MKISDALNRCISLVVVEKSGFRAGMELSVVLMISDPSCKDISMPKGRF